MRVDHRNFLCFMNVSNPNQTSVRFIKIAIKECIAGASSSIIFEFLLKDKDLSGSVCYIYKNVNNIVTSLKEYCKLYMFDTWLMMYELGPRRSINKDQAW